mgnify:CR=1 FL=1
MFAIEKEIDLTYEEVNLIAGENRTDSYLGINPFGVVPSLELPNGEYLNESVAICEYLEEQADFPKLIGDSANKRATQRSWQRRIELLVSENIYNAYRFSVGLEIYKDRVHCIPDAAEDLEKAARKNLMIIDQLIENRTWIKGFINYKVGVDGISILFIILTTFITPLCIISVNNSVKNRLRDFLIAILIMESFMIGVFCALDLVVFYLFFEAGLIPMFLIIGIWGGARRVYSAFKFFLYTLLGSVLMLVAIISIYWITGTTDVIQLYEIGIDVKYQNLLWLAFFSSFAVKTPMWPVHTWLPDAHVEAPTAGSVLLAAILLKMAGYGFIRFSLGLFPVATEIFTPLIYLLSVFIAGSRCCVVMVICQGVRMERNASFNLLTRPHLFGPEHIMSTLKLVKISLLTIFFLLL